MKKTIAILLILVIGMVGVFAANDLNAKIYLRTTVDPINQMAVVSNDAQLSTYVWAETNGAIAEVWNADTTEDAYPVTDANLTEDTIAQLFARSNNRAGVTLTVDATPLIDTTAVGGENVGIDYDSDYIDYSLAVGDTAKLNFVNGNKTVTSASIGSLSYSDAVAVAAWPIKLKLDEALADAAAGTYTGNITFTFKTN